MTTILILVMIFCLMMVGMICLIFFDYRKSMGEMMNRQEQQASRQAQETYQLANSVTSAMTEATTKLSDSQLNWARDMVLGREQVIEQSGTTQGQQESEKLGIPGIDTLEGLPESIRRNLEREHQEAERHERLSLMPPMPLEQRLNGQLPNRSPSPSRTPTPEGWITE